MSVSFGSFGEETGNAGYWHTPPRKWGPTGFGRVRLAGLLGVFAIGGSGASTCAQTLETVHAARQTLTAYSLNEAFRRIESSLAKGLDFRTESDLMFLGGISRPSAVVIDSDTNDWIIVGERAGDSSPLELDDWVVALRSRFIYGKDPGVSIDPRRDPTDSDQDVVFFGGIAKTRFGRVCYDADWLMKLIGQGEIEVPIEGFESYLDVLRKDNVGLAGGKMAIRSRFWFLPVVNQVNVLPKLVLLQDFQMGVFTEIQAVEIDGEPMSNPAGFDHDPSQRFARSLTQYYDAVAATPRGEPLRILKGLTRLAGLAEGLLAVQERPEALTYWLNGFPVAASDTRETVEILRTKRDNWVLSGGVRLSSLATRWAEGDSEAFRDVVLLARGPEPRLTWDFEVELVAGRPTGIRIPDRGEDPNQIVPLWTQALFLFEQRRYAAAASLLDQICRLVPDLAQVYNLRGAANAKRKEFAAALADFDRALAINPDRPGVHYNRGNAHFESGGFEAAAADYTKAIDLNPRFALAFANRGNARLELGQEKEALEDFQNALRLDPGMAQGHFSLASFYASLGFVDKALVQFDAALAADPALVSAYLAKAAVLEDDGQFGEALQAYQRFVRQSSLQSEDQIDPRWREFALERVRELMIEESMPPVYTSHHGRVSLMERIEKLLPKLAEDR